MPTGDYRQPEMAEAVPSVTTNETLLQVDIINTQARRIAELELEVAHQEATILRYLGTMQRVKELVTNLEE